jgi:hypothetical protein
MIWIFACVKTGKQDPANPGNREEGGGEGSHKKEYRKDVEEFSKGKRRMKEISD